MTYSRKGTNISLMPHGAATATGAQESVQLPVGLKSFSAVVTGTGAVSATVDIEISNDGVNFRPMVDQNGDPISISISGTAPPPAGFSSYESWLYHRANITAISGTGAAVTVVVGV